MNKKKIIIGFSLLAAFILMLMLSLWALQKEPSDELKIEQAKQTALEDAEIKTKTDDGFINASIVSNLEDRFQITYQEEADKFSIHIDTGGRDAEKYLTKEEVGAVREIAEQYFVKEVLKLEDQHLACSLDVDVATLGYGYRMPVSGLSFCQ